jgi:hypothetical protein
MTTEHHSRSSEAMDCGPGGREHSAWFEVAREPAVVKRALKCALVVGAILIAINHGDAIAQGTVTGLRLFQMGLTLLIPYCVSTFSSVSAMRVSSSDREPRSCCSTPPRCR